MPSLADAELPPPKSWDAFEELCADLFQREWKFPHTARYGRQGQRQNGVDIYGRPGGSGHSGVQCKGKRRWPPSKITKTEIDREVAKALKFRPKLEELIFATTAENDTVIQDHVNSITERHEKTGLFRVYVYWWGEIARRITLYDDLTRKHFQFARIASDVLVSEVRAMLLPVGLIDQEISKQLEQITRSRFFGSVDSSEIAERFSARILTGDLQGGSPSKRADALAWCARLLAFEHTSRAEDMLNQAKLLGSSDALCLISNAFIAAASGDNNGALFILSALQTSAARTAAFIVANKGDSFEECTRWLAQVGFSVDDLDADGKFQFISRCLAGQQWDKAIEVIGSLTDQDYHQTPTLLYTAGISHLIQATPEEFRPLLVRQLPFELSTFPLGSTEIMRAHRDFAREFFGKCSKAAEVA